MIISYNKSVLSLIIVISILFLKVVLSSYINENPNPKVSEKVKEIFIHDINSFSKNSSHMTHLLELLNKQEIKLKEVQDVFRQLKRSFKKLNF